MASGAAAPGVFSYIRNCYSNDENASGGAASGVAGAPAKQRPQEGTDARPAMFNLVPSKRTILPSAIMLISFFIPWFSYGGLSLNGPGVGKIGNLGIIVWLMPVLSGITIIASLMGDLMAVNLRKLLPRLTAASPYICLLILYMSFQRNQQLHLSVASKMGELSRNMGHGSADAGSFLSLISIGVYTTIISSVWLGFVSFRDKN